MVDTKYVEYTMHGVRTACSSVITVVAPWGKLARALGRSRPVRVALACSTDAPGHDSAVRATCPQVYVQLLGGSVGGAGGGGDGDGVFSHEQPVIEATTSFDG